MLETPTGAPFPHRARDSDRTHDLAPALGVSRAIHSPLKTVPRLLGKSPPPGLGPGAQDTASTPRPASTERRPGPPPGPRPPVQRREAAKKEAPPETPRGSLALRYTETNPRCSQGCEETHT